MKKFNQNEQGRSMIEMLGVLAIVGVLSVAGIAGYSKGMAKYKANQLIDQVSTISANVKTIFANGEPYTKMNGTGDGANGNATLKKLKAFPDAMTKTSTVTHAFNGACTVTGSSNSFDIKLESLPAEGCAALVLASWGDAAGFSGIKIGTAAATNDITGAASCADNNNIVTLTFK